MGLDSILGVNRPCEPAQSIAHLEALRTDGRDEIKRRIQQRDFYSIQLTVALAAILAATAPALGSPRILLLAPLVSLYFAKLIFLSYRLHDLLAEWLRDEIEPRLSNLSGTPREIEWETWQTIHEPPGIRRKLFVLIPWSVLVLTVFCETWLYWRERLFFPLIEGATACYVTLALMVTQPELHWRRPETHRDWLREPRAYFRTAVFLDRDGTLNEDTHYPADPQEMALVSGALQGVLMLSRLPLQLIVVSNQAGIALGLFTRKDMSRFNSMLRSKIEHAGGRIDAFYYCPHLERKNLKSGVKSCPYSKPAPGMLMKAARDFKIDLSNSFMIGDKKSDIAAGNAAGCKTILIQTGNPQDETEFEVGAPTHIATDLVGAAEWIRSNLHAGGELDET